MVPVDSTTHARGAGDYVLMDDRFCGIIGVAWDDFTQPTYSRRWHTASCGHCSPGPGSMGTMRPALRYRPPNPAGQGHSPGNWKVFHVGTAGEGIRIAAHVAEMNGVSAL